MILVGVDLGSKNCGLSFCRIDGKKEREWVIGVRFNLGKDSKTFWLDKAVIVGNRLCQIIDNETMIAKVAEPIYIAIELPFSMFPQSNRLMYSILSVLYFNLLHNSDVVPNKIVLFYPSEWYKIIGGIGRLNKDWVYKKFQQEFKGRVYFITIKSNKKNGYNMEKIRKNQVSKDITDSWGVLQALKIRMIRDNCNDKC